jgi:hypothetical protein
VQANKVNAATVDAGLNFHHDIDRLIRSIDGQTSKKNKWWLVLRSIPWRYGIYAFAGLLVCRLVYLEYVMHSGGLAKIDEFFSCGARVLYPAVSFRDELRTIKGVQVRVLAHADKEAIVRLYSSPIMEKESIPELLDKLSRGATVSYKSIQSEFGILTGWRSSQAVSSVQEEFYYRLQSTPDKRFFIMYEMTHPPKEQANHPYWNVNEILSRTLLPKGTLSESPASCDFRQDLR